MPRTKETSLALNEGEREDGVICVAAPVRDYPGKVIAAVSVSGPYTRLGPYRADAEKKTLLCATNISRNLGWNGAEKKSPA